MCDCQLINKYFVDCNNTVQFGTFRKIVFSILISETPTSCLQDVRIHWRFGLFWMLQCVVGLEVPDVSKDSNVFILKCWRVPVTRRQLNHQRYRSGNLKFRVPTATRTSHNVGTKPNQRACRGTDGRISCCRSLTKLSACRWLHSVLSISTEHPNGYAH